MQKQVDHCREFKKKIMLKLVQKKNKQTNCILIDLLGLVSSILEIKEIKVRRGDISIQTSHLNSSLSLNQTPRGAKTSQNSTALNFSGSRARKEQGTLALQPMQPLKSSRSSTEAVSWKMSVPVTLQPDGAWKRPAHTGPSLAEAPVGLQSPYCTRPPKWVQKQERRARRDSAPIRLVPARTASI